MTVLRPNTGVQEEANPTPTVRQPRLVDTLSRQGGVVVFSSIPGLTSQRVLKKPFIFQCPPTEDFAPTFSWSWNEFGTIDGQTHSNPQYRAPTVLSFTSFFDDDDSRWWVRSPLRPIGGPLGAEALLIELGDSLTPFQMQAGNPALWGRWEPLGRRGQAAVAVTLRSFTPREKPGEPTTRYVDVAVSWYADAPKLKNVTVPKALQAKVGPALLASGSGPGVVDPQTGQRVYALLDPRLLSDRLSTLRLIAKEFYGSYSRWPLIAKASGFDDVPPDADLRVALADRRPMPKIVVPAVGNR